MPWPCQAWVGVHSDTVHTAVDQVMAHGRHGLNRVYTQFKHSLNILVQFKHIDKICTAVGVVNSWLRGDTVYTRFKHSF